MDFASNKRSAVDMAVIAIMVGAIAILAFQAFMPMLASADSTTSSLVKAGNSVGSTGYDLAKGICIPIVIIAIVILGLSCVTSFFDPHFGALIRKGLIGVLFGVALVYFAPNITTALITTFKNSGGGKWPTIIA